GRGLPPKISEAILLAGRVERARRSPVGEERLRRGRRRVRRFAQGVSGRTAVPRGLAARVAGSVSGQEAGRRPRAARRPGREVRRAGRALRTELSTRLVPIRPEAFPRCGQELSNLARPAGRKPPRGRSAP